mgnify:CR=1 FL=1
MGTSGYRTDTLRKRNSGTALGYCRLYDGIPELLKTLRDNGIKTVVASAKPQYILDPTIDYFGVRDLFDGVFGSQEEGRPDNDKKAIVSRAMLGKSCIMAGDSPYDIDGGRDNGIDTIAALYGFGFTSRAKAEKSLPTYIAESVKELGDIILGKNQVRG